MRFSLDVGRWHLALSRDTFTGRQAEPERDHGAGDPLDSLVETGPPDPHPRSELDHRTRTGFGAL